MENIPQPQFEKPEILRRETFVKMVENSIGTRLFNSIIAKKGEEIVDILGDGDLSCATFVSNILYLNHLLDNQRVVVGSLEKDLSASPNFEEISPENYLPKTGDVILWSKIIGVDGIAHRHFGFALSDEEAVSTTGISHSAIRHPLYKKPDTDIDRPIERIFRVKK